MHHTLKKYLEELNAEVLLLHSPEINEEAHANMHTFGVSPDLLQEWGASSIADFLAEVSELYKAKNTNSQMVFYSWFDEMASQVRLSAVSSVHGRLPFGCQIETCNLETLVKGIMAIDGGLFTKSKRLLVWKKQI